MATSEASTQVFSNRLYNWLVFVAQIVLPLLATLWFTVGSTWNLSHTTEVVGTITAVDLFLGGLLKYASVKYYKSGSNFDGQVALVQTESGEEKVRFNLERKPEEVIIDNPGKHSLEFKIERPNGQNSTS